MMVHVDLDALHLMEPSVKVLYGYAGILIQLLYMLVIGGLLKPYRVFSEQLSFSMYCNAMFAWTLAYIYGYAIHFYDDPTADFALFTAACKSTATHNSTCTLF